MTLRRVPHVLMPLPDEPFDSWVEFMAHSHTATVGEMARSLGLIAHEGTPSVNAQSARAWSTALTPRQLDLLGETTGRSGAEFAAMTREVFAANAIRHTPQGRISASCPSSGIAGRYCPDCLADSGGRWRLSWQFPFGFVCIRHQRLLVDACPRCGQPPRLIGHPLTLVPEPGRCHNRPRDAGNAIRLRCGADLANAHDARRASREMLGAQRAMLRIVASGSAAFGVYSDSRPRTVQALSDFALLSRLGRQALVDGDRFEWFDPDAEDLEVIRSKHAAGKVELRPSGAQEVALGNTLAFMALQDEARLWELIRGRISDHTALDHYSSAVRVQLSRALGRKSRPTTILQSQSAVDIAPETRAAKIPAVLWPQWTAALSPRRLDPEIAGSALSAAVVFTGTHLTHGAAIRLLDPKPRGRQVSHVMRSLGHNAPEADTIRALTRLVAYLDERETPIDYTRRRALDYSGILPARVAEHLP